MLARRNKYIISAVACASIVAAYGIFLGVSCNGGKGDPTGALKGLLDPDGKQITGQAPASDTSSARTTWGGYLLDIRPDEGRIDVLPLDRSTDAHFDVTGYVKKPACLDCVKLQNFSFDKSAGIIDVDAKLTNPTTLGGYDVRGVLLLNEFGTGRRLQNASGLTDLWSKDPYHPDPFINFAKEDPDRYFGPSTHHTAHVRLFVPTPHNLVVPFIVDACYPKHSWEPVEMTNVKTSGSVHPTGYDLKISVDLLDWQGDAKGVYADCSVLNPFAGLYPFDPPESGSTWTIDLMYDPNTGYNWLPTVTGPVDLPLFALDPKSTARLYKRVPIDVVPDTAPPVWTGDVGIEQVYWGGSKAIIAFYPASDPSGPVKYNIRSTNDIPLIPPTKDTVTGCAHYSLEITDNATYHFVVTAEDQAGNETDNTGEISGMSNPIGEIWKKAFIADLDSSPTVRDINSDNVQDVVFGCDDGKVYSLAGGSGAIEWEYQTGSMIKSTPALRDVNDDGTIDVVVGSYDSSVYALGMIFGQPYPFKTFTTTNVVESSPVCSDMTGDGIPEVVVGSYDGKLYGFQGGTGDLLISYDTGAAVKATPSLEDFNGDGHLDVVVASGGVVRAINGTNGTSLWSYDFKTGFSLGSPAIGDLTGDGVGDVVLGSGDSVYALDVKNHDIIWATKLTGNFDSSPALGDFNGDGVPDVAISSRYLNVCLLDGTDGHLVWVSHDTIYQPTSPTIADMNNDGIPDVVVGAADFRLRVLNGADGFTLYSYLTDPCTPITTIPLLADVNSDGKIDIVFGTDSNEMIALTTNQPLPSDAKLIPWPKYMRTRSNTGNLKDPLF